MPCDTLGLHLPVSAGVNFLSPILFILPFLNAFTFTSAFTFILPRLIFVLHDKPQRWEPFQKM